MLCLHHAHKDISANIGAGEMEFGSFDSGDDGEHGGVGLVEINEIYLQCKMIFLMGRSRTPSLHVISCLCGN